MKKNSPWTKEQIAAANAGETPTSFMPSRRDRRMRYLRSSTNRKTTPGRNKQVIPIYEEVDINDESKVEGLRLRTLTGFKTIFHKPKA